MIPTKPSEIIKDSAIKREIEDIRRLLAKVVPTEYKHIKFSNPGVKILVGGNGRLTFYDDGHPNGITLDDILAKIP